MRRVENQEVREGDRCGSRPRCVENQEAPRSPSPTLLPSLQEVTRTSTPPGSQWQSPRGGPPAAAAYGDGYAQPHYGAPEPVPTLYPLLYATARLLQHLRDSAVGGCDAQQRAAIARLVAAGDSMLSRVRDAEAVRGRGFGCGGLGSGVAHVRRRRSHRAAARRASPWGQRPSCHRRSTLRGPVPLRPLPPPLPSPPPASSSCASSTTAS